jgi:hypothetical protein
MTRTASMAPGAAGGDEHPEPGEVAGAARAAEHLLAGGDDVGRLGQAPRADVAPGEVADPGLDHDHARLRRRATLACTAGCSHISVCMAGHTTTGRTVASSVATSRSSDRPMA